MTAFDKWQSTPAFMMGNRDLAASKNLWEHADFDQDIWEIMLMFPSDKVEVFHGMERLQLKGSTGTISKKVTLV